MAATDDASAVWLQLDVLAEEAGVVGSNWLQFVVQFPEPVASGTNTESTPGNATIDGSASEGTKFRWKWTSVPVGSAVGNKTTAYPDSGAVTPVDMTDNEGLYHTDSITGGTTFDDTSGNNNDITIGNISLGTGKVGPGSAVFDGVDSELLLDTPVVTSGNDYTIAFWFKGLKANTGYRTGARGTGPADYHHIIVPTGSDTLGVWTGSLQSSGFTMVPANYTGWNHLVAVGNDAENTTTFFINGVGVGTAPAKVDDPIGVLGNINSAVSTGQVFADEMTEIAVWSRAITAKEAWDIYALQEGSYAGEEGKTDTLSFTADEVGDYTATLEVVYGGGDPASTSLTTTIVQLGGYDPRQGGILDGQPTLQGAVDARGQGGILNRRPKKRHRR